MISLGINEKLNNLLAWQQSVFCMALSEQTKLHFQLFNEAIESDDFELINNINLLFWEKMTTKGSKINFTLQQEKFDELIPDVNNFDFYGVYPAVDHCVILNCTFNAFLTKSSDEAINASQTMFSTIARFIEMQEDTLIEEAQLKEHELFIDQLEFQETLLNMLDAERSPELIVSIKHYIEEHGTTNLGISFES